MFSRSFLFVASAVCLAAVCGCSNQEWRPEATATATELRGTVMGGQQPIIGATIQLYAVGTTGFQSASRTLLSHTVTTDANGGFNITGLYTCGTATQVYITATGGNAIASGANANAAMMTAIGPCSSLSATSFISINELTTAAAVSALAPYMASATQMGSSSGGTYSQDEALALAQAFTLAQALVDQTSGRAPGTGIPSGMSSPVALLNSLANTLAYCINSTGGVATDTSTPCGSFFSLTPSSAGTAPTDTVTAMLNLANHPTANATALYNLGSPSGPFQGGLTSAPASWDVALVPPAATITRTLYIMPDNGLSFAYSLINNAASTIDMTMYGFVDTTMSADLVAACQRGVTVRVILDQNVEMNQDTPVYNQLNAQTHCSAAWANPAFQVTHQKSFIVDGTKLALLTLNLTSSAYANTRDFALVTNDPVDIAAVQATFNADYGSTTDYTFVPPTGNDLIWSPTTARGSLVSLINNATTSLLVETEELSDTTAVNALKNACLRGVAVHITMTDATSYHSNFAALEAAGCGVHVFANNSHTLYIHAKAMVADYGTAAQIGYMGSINFSLASEIENRELGTFVSDATALQGLNTTLTTDYGNATAY